MNEIETLNNIFLDFKIEAQCKNFTKYKNAFSYDIELLPGARVQQLERYLTEISLILKAPSKPKLEVKSEDGVVKLEYIARPKDKINLFEFGYNIPKPSGKLQCLMGEDARGQPLWIDFADAPHTLVAGTTGSGKSTFLHSLIANLLVSNAVVDLIDPKSVEFCAYKQLSSKINLAFEYNECLTMVSNLCNEMEKRYSVLRAGGKVNDHFPYKVLIIDEFADLIMQDSNKRIYKALCKLIQKSRAAGIHIILATQRPSVNVVEGTIKANIPMRISFKVASSVDSKIILGVGGGEDLLGRGDAIINGGDYQMKRFQAAYTTAEEVCSYFR